MNSGEYDYYLWQAADWPRWRFDWQALAQPLAQVSLAYGQLLGRLADVGFELRAQACLAALTEDVLKTSAIEDEVLDAHSVRLSIARRLGLAVAGLPAEDRQVEGVVAMVMDASGNAAAPLTAERLFGWHAALFPTGYSGMFKIRTGQWRDDAGGPMQVVSGPISRQRVHYQAPPAARLAEEMQRFLVWVEQERELPPLIKAGLGHLWFVSLHPFDDGNGRIARAIGDLLLARADGSSLRFFSLSAQIQREREAYYRVLERTQKGAMDVTEWLLWFLTALENALQLAQQTLDAVLFKSRCWRHWGALVLNERQIKVLNKLLDGFEGKLRTGKWAALANCSTDTALRDIEQLVALGGAGQSGRRAQYQLRAGAAGG